MELHRLRYFVAVAECEHFREAAERLHVAQPALSRQIASLEDDLGTPLFERLPRGVRLTPAGREFLTDCRQILRDFQRARERARRIGRGQIGTLRISFSEAGSWHGIFPNTIVEFRSTYPGVELVLQPLHSPAQVAGLCDRTFDASFLYAPAADEAPVEKRIVQSDPIVVAMPATHLLTARESVSMRELTGVPLVWTTRALNPHFDDALMAACVQHGLVPNIVQEVSRNAVVLTLVAVGIGCGLVPASMRWRMQEGVVLKPIADLELRYDVALAWHRHNTSPVLAQFIEVALKHADKAALQAFP